MTPNFSIVDLCLTRYCLRINYYSAMPAQKRRPIPAEITSARANGNCREEIARKEVFLKKGLESFPAHPCDPGSTIASNILCAGSHGTSSWFQTLNFVSVFHPYCLYDSRYKGNEGGRAE
jgi:hypothetical protein